MSKRIASATIFFTDLSEAAKAQVEVMTTDPNVSCNLNPVAGGYNLFITALNNGDLTDLVSLLNTKSDA